MYSGWAHWSCRSVATFVALVVLVMLAPGQRGGSSFYATPFAFTPAAGTYCVETVKPQLKHVIQMLYCCNQMDSNSAIGRMLKLQLNGEYNCTLPTIR